MIEELCLSQRMPNSADLEKVILLNKTEMLGLSFINTDMSTLVNELDKRLEHGEQTFLVTVNTEIYMYARKHQDYLHTIEHADLITPDGIGMIMGAKIFGSPIQRRLTGYDLMIQLFRLGERRSYKYFLLGAEPEVIEETAQHVKRNFPALDLAGYHHGYFEWDDESVLRKIKMADPDVVLVGLGVPKQEEWIGEFRKSFDKGLFIGVGGSFDVLSGRIKRAPMIWQRLNLEWLYRLIQRPSRWKRMMVLPIFIMKVIFARIMGKKRI